MHETIMDFFFFLQGLVSLVWSSVTALTVYFWYRKTFRETVRLTNFAETKQKNSKKIHVLVFFQPFLEPEDQNWALFEEAIIAK